MGAVCGHTRGKVFSQSRAFWEKSFGATLAFPVPGHFFISTCPAPATRKAYDTSSPCIGCPHALMYVKKISKRHIGIKNGHRVTQAQEDQAHTHTEAHVSECLCARVPM